MFTALRFITTREKREKDEPRGTPIQKGRRWASSYLRDWTRVFWSHLGCSWQKATIFNNAKYLWGCTRRNHNLKKRTCVRFKARFPPVFWVQSTIACSVSWTEANAWAFSVSCGITRVSNKTTPRLTSQGGIVAEWFRLLVFSCNLEVLGSRPPPCH